MNIALTPRKQPISVGSYRARIFCKGCNQHFKHLEDAALPFLVAMGKGQNVVLDANSKSIIALWGAKTGVALFCSQPEFRDFVPVEHRLSIRFDHRPPDDCFVGYGYWAGTVQLAVLDGTLQETHISTAPGQQTWSVVFTFAQLALKVFGFFEPPAGFVIDGDRPSLKQVWPQETGQLVWPPSGPAALDGNMPHLIEFIPLRRMS